jgi:hypothetical protein
MASVFQDSEGMINVNFLPHGVTVNAQYYSNLLRNDVRLCNSEEKTWVTVKGHRMFTCGKFDIYIGKYWLGNHESLSLSPDLAPSDFVWTNEGAPRRSGISN